VLFLCPRATGGTLQDKKPRQSATQKAVFTQESAHTRIYANLSRQKFGHAKSSKNDPNTRLNLNKMPPN
jgi:hypothetical protein